MKLNKGKLFWKKSKENKKVDCIYWDEQKDYYSFVKDNIKSGYHQIIISSEVFMSFLKYAIIKEKFTLIEIEFMEEDLDFDNNIANIINLMQDNITYFVILMDQLRTVAEKSSIEIRKVSFKGRIDNVAFQFFVQSNGLVGINSEAYNVISDKINSHVKECLF